MANRKNAITGKQIDREIGTFVQSRDALRHHAHTIAMMILYHCAPEEVSSDCQGSGDCTRFTKLCRAMPASWAEQMVAWAANFTPITIVLRNSGDSVGYNAEYRKMSPEDKVTAWNVAGAAETPFWEFQKEREPEQLKTFEDVLKMVEGLSKRVAKMVKEDKIEEKDLLSAEAVSATLSSLRFKRVEKPLNDDEGVKETPKARATAKAA